MTPFSHTSLGRGRSRRHSESFKPGDGGIDEIAEASSPSSRLRTRLLPSSASCTPTVHISALPKYSEPSSQSQARRTKKGFRQGHQLLPESKQRRQVGGKAREPGIVVTRVVLLGGTRKVGKRTGTVGQNRWKILGGKKGSIKLGWKIGIREI